MSPGGKLVLGLDSIDGPHPSPGSVRQLTEEEQAAVMEAVHMVEPLVCPFCREEDFDLIGLKVHLTMHCSAYDRTPVSDAGVPYGE